MTRFKSRILESRIGRAAPRTIEVIYDYAIPALIAVAYVFLQRHSHPADANVIKDFGSAFFVAGWFTNVILRIDQKQQQQQNHSELKKLLLDAETARQAEAREIMEFLKLPPDSPKRDEAAAKILISVGKTNAANNAVAAMLSLPFAQWQAPIVRTPRSVARTETFQAPFVPGETDSLAKAKKTDQER